MMTAFLHPAISVLAFFQATQLNLFERFLTQAVAGIDSTNITAGMQNVAYVVLVVGFLWQVYQSALHGGDVRGLGTNLIKYVVTAIVVMNYHAIFTTLNQDFVNAGNWVNSASGAGNLFENWASDLQTQFSQIGFQKMWGLITGSVAGLIDAMLILIAYVLYPVVIVIFGFFYILYGSILYIFGPIVIGLMPLGATNRLAKSYAENVFIWNAWPVLYGGFGALLSAVQMGQVGQMLNQNNFLGGLGNLEGSFLIGFASIIFSLAIAIIPFIAKRIVSGDVGATAAALIGAAATAITAGTAAIEGIGAGAAAAGAASGTGASAGTAAESAASRSTSAGNGNQPAPVQKGQDASPSKASNNPATSKTPTGTKDEDAGNKDSGAPENGASGGEMGSSGQAETGGFQPTAGLHAAEMRRTIGGAMYGNKAEDDPPSSGTSASPEQSASNTATSNTSSLTKGAGGSRQHSRPPSARGAGLATWGAYHAARLTSYGAVSSGMAVGSVAEKITAAARNPVETAGKIGTHTGRVAGAVANTSVNAGRAAQSAIHAVSHPVETAQSASSAVTGAVSNTASRVATTAKDSVSVAGLNFSESYNEVRRNNETKPDGSSGS
jgi:hypothetical protein